jgi:endogenous inhibitor of DNA gyrase (YacG/DUF329 family)
MDSSDFINEGLQEQDFLNYKCPTCGKEKEVAVEWNKRDKCFEPCHLIDILCENCDELCDMV